MIRVYLVDDHALVRTGFRMLLSQYTDFSVVGEAGTGEQALADLRTMAADVVLCDLHLPGISGLEVTDRLIRSGSQTKVIVVSAQEDGPLPRRVLSAGAHGYLGKAAPAEELLRAMRDVAKGKRYISSTVAQQMAITSLDTAGSPFEQLSVRELEVAMLLVQGMRMTVIGDNLNLSSKTVATHKYNLFAKLQVSDIASLTRLALQHGLTSA
ncbi:response regulator [Xanthomonadaceae bacterium JHOS43]|nr:response regulator [Xanthomonadaceae bacterium JHOS43]